MSEDDARAWIDERFGVPRGTLLKRYADLLVEENDRQNLISAATIPTLWQRHLLDSAQLLPLAHDAAGLWVDIGSGAGLPGLVVATLSDRLVALVEPRKRRAEFLQQCADALGIADRVQVIATTIERAPPLAPAVISARAVAATDVLLTRASAIAAQDTLWVLPKGRSAESEVAAARRTWHGRFDLVPSITDPDARIILIRRAMPR